MKRQVFMREFFGRIAMTFLLLCLIVYTVYHAVWNSSGSLQTLPTKQVSDVQLLTGTAYLFRDESVVTVPDAGLVNSSIKDGAKVGKNTKIAEVWVGTPVEELEEKQQELNSINRFIKILEDSLSVSKEPVSKAEDYRKGALQKLFEIRLALQNGEYTAISELEEKMLVLLNRYGVLTGEKANLEQALEQARADRSALLLGTPVSVRNDLSSAYYYGTAQVDGYETLYTENALNGLTAESLFALKNADPVDLSPSTVVGKLCYSYTWHIAVEFEAGASRLFEPDAAYTFSFTDNNGMELSLICQKMIDGEEGKEIGIFRSEVTPSDFRFLRTQNVRITVGITNGFYIPEQALQQLNGETGVFVFEESTVYFRKIDVIYRGDGYCIADGSGGGTACLKLNDLMITSGKNLYDGKVYQ